MNIKEYIWNIFVVLDQTVNTVAAGKPDCTVSACSYVYYKTDKFWSLMRKVINFSFYPIDGHDHCKQAFERDNETYNKGGLFRKSTIALVTIPFCVLLSILTWTYQILKTLKVTLTK